MDYKTYRKETLKNISQFDITFHPERKWQNVKLTAMSPCNNCNFYKDYERGVEVSPPCTSCLEKAQWNMECFEKLCWYENNDKHLKKE